MIWTLNTVDAAFLDAFEAAGDPDEAVIASYVARHGQHAPKNVGVKRWYYLLKENPRVRLGTVGRPLGDWPGAGGVKILVGTSEIIGEFPGNRALVGQMGLHLQMEPIAWLQGEADRHFASGAALLAEISEQILDRRAIQQSQRRIQKRYEHRKENI